MEVERSHCLRNKNSYGEDQMFTIAKAKAECSKTKRCVGIEYVGDKYNDEDENHFKVCMDAIYSSTAWVKYENLTSKLLKKDESYG